MMPHKATADETGELHAVDVARSNSTVQKDTKEGQTCIGKVKSFRGEWGFITSDSLEGDVFLHLRDNPGLPPLSPGETVEFTVGGSERLHAENVRLLRRTSPLSELLGQICSGTVRKFSGEWGFITSPHFDGDVFVGLRSNRHLGGPLVTGDIVEFRITRDVSKEKDTFEASNVRILSPATHATTSPVLPVLPVPVPSRSRSPRKAREMATLVGKKSFRGDWGFVISESFAGDLFVGTRSNGHLSTSLKEGDMISFRVEIGSGKAEVENDLDRILRHSRGKSCSYVCQKYIENPLLIGGARKHDIRQWVMVTALNPLTIYFFSECYVKLAAEDYSLDDFGDRFKHLTHTVIMKNHPNFNPDDEDWRCQWTQDRYRSLLSEKAGYDVWNDKIRPAMQKIVVNSLLSVAEVLSKSENHSCSFQLFGYDFMVDDEYNVWLLEVNDIPMLKASGPVTSRLCDPCLREALGMIFDVDTSPKNEGLRFELLYRGPEIPKLPKTALEFSVDGRKLLPKAIPGPARAPSLRLSARRDQELQDLMDKRRLKEGKEQQEKERQLRLRRSLAKKLLGGKSISSPCLENLKDRHVD
ncbi:unnamed protein product [Cladocopium goreaui]|uniref:Tubulin glycylase 3C n=1 Tax=Cladocopium goreaui TaxID=2562237 RepID=A0A9P1BVL0_9DINO|nr:unnamed protein product [Cladocopium goreaui]